MTADCRVSFVRRIPPRRALTSCESWALNPSSTSARKTTLPKSAPFIRYHPPLHIVVCLYMYGWVDGGVDCLVDS
jgi:hypothetical protein